MPVQDSSLSSRMRFEVFKRDEFTCKYCGRTSPEVVLEVDHIIPRCEGGLNDPMNLTTACWDCNRGKSGVALEIVMTGEDPHDRAILLLERERQLREYNSVLAIVSERVERECGDLRSYWKDNTGKTLYGAEESGLYRLLEKHPFELVKRAMDLALRHHKTNSLAYVHACLKNMVSRCD